MSRAFIQKAVRLLRTSIPSPVTPPITPEGPIRLDLPVDMDLPIDLEIPIDLGGIDPTGLPTPINWPGDLETQTPLDPTAPPTQAANDAAEEGSTTEVEEIEYYCPNKWLVITITRHTKHNFGGRWDCTVGDLKMEIWDEEDSGSGTLIFKCKTSERGGPAHSDFNSETNNTGRYLIVPRDSYGVAPWPGIKYKTYGFNKNAKTDPKEIPRPGISVFGKAAGAMDERSEVVIHMGSSHKWSVGCIVLHKEGAVSGGKYRFDMSQSYDTVTEFLDKIHKFKGKSRLPISAKVDRVRLIIREKF